MLHRSRYSQSEFCSASSVSFLNYKIYQIKIKYNVLTGFC
jgi:hypothetical protein